MGTWRRDNETETEIASRLLAEALDNDRKGNAMDRAIGERVKGRDGSPYEKRTGTVTMVARGTGYLTEPLDPRAKLPKGRGKVCRVRWYGSVSDSPVRPEWIEEG